MKSPVTVISQSAVVEEEEEEPEWTNFTGTLPFIMALQTEEAPELDIPQPLHKLLKALKKLGGI